MRKLTFILALLMLSCLSLRAQPSRYSLENRTGKIDSLVNVWLSSTYMSAATLNAGAFHLVPNNFDTYELTHGVMRAGDISYTGTYFYYYDATGLHQFGEAGAGGGAGTVIGAANLGGTGLYKSQSGGTLQFAGLAVGSDMTLSSGVNTVTMDLGANVPRVNIINTWTGRNSFLYSSASQFALYALNIGGGPAIQAGSTTGYALWGSASGSGTGVYGSSSTGTAGYFSSGGIGVMVDVTGSQSPMVLRSGGTNVFEVNYAGLVTAPRFTGTDVQATYFRNNSGAQITETDLYGHDAASMSGKTSGAWVWNGTSYEMRSAQVDSTLPGYLGKTSSTGKATINSFIHEYENASGPLGPTGGIVVVDSSAEFFGEVSLRPDSILANHVIDWNLGNNFYTTINTGTTFTFARLVHPGQEINVRIRASGSYTCTWPAGIVWAGGSAPVQTASKVDFYWFKLDATGVVYGAARQNF